MSDLDFWLILALIVTGSGWAIYAIVVFLYPFQTRPGNPLDWDEDDREALRQVLMRNCGKEDL